MLWHGRYLLAPTLSTTRWEADKLQARIGAADIAVVPIVAVWGGDDALWAGHRDWGDGGACSAAAGPASQPAAHLDAAAGP